MKDLAPPVFSEKDYPGERRGISTERIVRSDGRPTHHVPLDIIRTRTWGNINTLYGGPCAWYACLVAGDGSAAFFGIDVMVPAPSPEVCHKMLDVGRALNRNLADIGFWVVIWHPQQRMEILWSDDDGTPKFSVGFDDPWARVRRYKIDLFLTRAADAMIAYPQAREETGVPVKFDRLRPAPKNPGWIGGRTLH
jgi:hypothetical protein